MAHIYPLWLQIITEKDLSFVICSYEIIREKYTQIGSAFEDITNMYKVYCLL